MRNVAKTGKRVLVEAKLQPVELVLTDARGKAIEPFDERSRQKLDTTTHKWLYQVLGPKSALTAYETEATREHGAWELRFGSFTFSALKPGQYRAQLRFTSATNAWVESDGSRGTYEDVWLGTIESPVVALDLP